MNVNFAENLSNLGEHSEGLSTLLHEIGHALGLNHPSNGPVFLPEDQDNDRFTVMTATLDGAVFLASGVFATTPMINDILAIQHLYGPNNDFNSGDTIYIFNDSQITYETLWDGGGIDAIIYDGSRPATINLTPGTFSSVGLSPDGSGATAIDNLGIAFGATIEIAVGGSAADLIIGNSAANILVGGAGADSLIGGAGSDTAVYSGSSAGVTVDLAAGTASGGDAAGDTLSGIENLLGSAFADSLTGDAGANVLIGGSGNDTLDGGAGVRWKIVPAVTDS